jgi:hypothetical protein
MRGEVRIGKKDDPMSGLDTPLKYLTREEGLRHARISFDRNPVGTPDDRDRTTSSIGNPVESSGRSQKKLGN